MTTCNAKVLSISTKGGVGKSTASVQMIVPALFELGNGAKVRLCECDDENSDSLSYGASQLFTRNLIGVDTPVLREELFEILASSGCTCIDVGGNKSTALVLEALSSSGAIGFVDLAIIPLLDGEQDGINAIDVYRRLKLLSPKLPVLFLLNRVKNIHYIQHQFENYFGDVRGIFRNINAVIDCIDSGTGDTHIAMLESDMVKYSRRFGLSVYEIASQERDFMVSFSLRESVVENLDEAKLLSFKYFVNNECKNYLNTSLRDGMSAIQSTIRRGR